MLDRISSAAVVIALILCPALLARADAKEDVQAAVKKLAETDGYSWRTSTEGGFASTTEGKTQKDGMTQLSLTMRDNTVEIVIKGDKAAVKTQDGWKSASEAADEQGPGRFLARMAQNFKSPAAQAQEIAEKAAKLDKSDEAVAGTLSEEGAKALLTFGGRRAGGQGPQVSDAKGTVKYWIKEGMLVKMQTNVQGKMTINNEDREINRTTTVEFKDIGSTKVDPPAEAKEKLK
jgi:hypothetical protein